MCELAITSLGVAVSPGRRRFFVSSWLSLVGLKLGVDISLCFPFYVTVFVFATGTSLFLASVVLSAHLVSWRIQSLKQCRDVGFT